uniref:Uncharacterized protein n=1 Tax=Megaviridae environmental sample TaxID=1737588 RepID=A0A5J6VLK5_9VIRU|nr:MAG: hypothetical protein [Megaviridae environmental sample]
MKLNIIFLIYLFSTPIYSKYTYILDFEGFPSNRSLEYNYGDTLNNTLFTYSNFEKCKSECTENKYCNGIYYLQMDNTTKCNGLKHIYNPINTTLASKSFRKKYSSNGLKQPRANIIFIITGIITFISISVLIISLCKSNKKRHDPVCYINPLYEPSPDENIKHYPDLYQELVSLKNIN